MVNTSGLYNTTIQMDSRSFVCRVTAGADTLGSEVSSLVQTLGSCGADSFTVGCVFASYVEITLSAAPFPLAGRELYVETGLCLPDGTVEYVPMGYYTASPSDIEKTRGRITVKAVDRLSSKCGGLYVPSVAFPASVGQLLDDIGAQAGISVETALGTSGTVTEPMEGLLYREALGYIAGLLGGFCYADRYGAIRIAAYPGGRTAGVDADRCLDDAQMAEDSYTVGSLAVTVKAGGTDADGNGDTGVSYAEGAGEGVCVSNPYMTQELFDAMKGRVLGYAYRPGTVRFLGDPRIGPEDALEVETWAGGRYLLPCMGITHDYDGGLTTTVTAPGKASSDTSARGPLQAAVDRLLADMVLTKEVVAKKITADEADLRFASIDSLQASNARIDTVSGDLAQYQTVVAGDLAALTARIDKITATDITVEYLTANYAAIDMANVTHGSIKNYHIGDGQIGSAQIADASITDAKIVELTANKINAGTLSVERLEIRGSTNSLVYAINNISGALQAQNVDTLNGEALTPRTVTADRLVARSITAGEIASNTITANEINVANLFAQDIEATGTIRGLHIVGATGDFSGTVNATGGVFRGTVYASAGEFTGKVTATSGSFTGAVNATSGTFRGTVYASAGEFTGKIKGEIIDIIASQTVSGLTWESLIRSSVDNGLTLESTGQGRTSGIRLDNGGINTYALDVTIAASDIIGISAPDVGIDTENGLVVGGSMTVTEKLDCGSDLYVSGWIRSTGSNGIYWQAYGGGWHMNDANWIRAWNNKGIYTGGQIQSGSTGDSFFVQRSDSAEIRFRAINSVGSIAMLVASDGRRGLYSHSNGGWLAYFDTSGKGYFNGHATGDLPLSGGTVTGNLTVNGYVKSQDTYNRAYSGTPNMYITENAIYARTSKSSRRYKQDIRPLSGSLGAGKLLSIPVIQYVYKPGYLAEDDQRYKKPMPGFIAEDVAEYYPAAAELDADGRPDDWNIRMVVPPMLALIQENYKTLAGHGARLSIAESRLSDLQTQLSDAMARAASQEAEIQSLRTKLEQLQAA